MQRMGWGGRRTRGRPGRYRTNEKMTSIHLRSPFRVWAVSMARRSLLSGQFDHGDARLWENMLESRPFHTQIKVGRDDGIECTSSLTIYRLEDVSCWPCANPASKPVPGGLSDLSSADFVTRNIEQVRVSEVHVVSRDSARKVIAQPQRQAETIEAVPNQRSEVIAPEGLVIIPRAYLPPR